MSLDLYVLSFGNGLLGEISDYESLEIERNYYSVSKMILRVPRNSFNVEFLRKGHLLALTNDPKYAYMIDYFAAIKEGKKDIIEVYAYSLNYILSYRTVPFQTVLNGHVEDVVKELIRRNVVEPTDINRVIPNFIFEDNLFSNNPIRVSKTGGNLMEHSFDILRQFDASIDIMLDFSESGSLITNKRIITWRGENRSIDQNTNNRVMFSPEFDNIISQNYFNSDLDFKNVAYVAGQGEGVNRFVQQVSDAIGLDRREQYIDARDLQDTYYDQNGGTQTLTQAEYIQTLNTRGIERLSELSTVESFESTVDDVQYILGVDYRLGDLVTFLDEELNIKKNVRVTSIKTISNSSGVINTPSFGTGIPNKLIG